MALPGRRAGDPPRAPAPWRLPGAPGSGLTADAQQDVYRRIQAITVAMFAIGLLYLLYGLVVIPRFHALRPLRMPPYSHMVFVAAMVVSAGLFALARARVFAPRQMNSLGLVYEVGIAFLMAVWNTIARAGLEDPRLGGISWLCIWILFYPMVVPSSRSRTLAAALLSAATEPLLGYLYFRYARSADFPPSLLLLWKENFVCAALAVVPAHVLWQMGREVHRARELGNYQLVRRLGRGGMGEVWEARHRHLARRVAVKIVSPDALGTLDEHARWLTLRQFEREAQATARLASPHTIEVYDFGLGVDGTFYYVMEFLDGYDLETWVRRFGPMPPPRAARVLGQAAHSLADAHHSGLVHRDVKPANIFVCRRGRDGDCAKVLDFGLVISNPARGAAPDPVEMHETNPAGTPAYMAPEQAAGETAVDERADIFALGCVGYWLLTGRHAREVSSVDELRRPRPSPPAGFDPPLCACLEDVLARCMAEDPAERPASMDEVIERIEACPFPVRWTAAQARAWWDRLASGALPPAGEEAARLLAACGRCGGTGVCARPVAQAAEAAG